MHDVVIIGSGPAGLTAALYLARAHHEPVVVEGAVTKEVMPGGQLMITTDVENYPGFPEGILGPDLMERFRAQAARFGTAFVPGDALRVDASRRPFTVKTTEGATLEARSVIVATGARPRKLGIPSEERLWARGISSCATCDGAFFQGKDILVLGGGDSAMEEAIFLTRHARRVSIVHRRKELRASKIMADRARANPKIDWLLGFVVKEFRGEKKLQSALLEEVGTGAAREVKVEGAFLGIGHLPNSDFLEGTIDLDEQGYVIVRDHVFTSKDGIFAAGDVHDHHYRQAVTASGFGCMAALECEKWLANHP